MKLLTKLLKSAQRRDLRARIVYERPELANLGFITMLERFIVESIATHAENETKQTEVPALVEEAVGFLSTKSKGYYNARLLVAEAENTRLRVLLDQSQKSMADFEAIANHCLDIAQDATGTRPSLN